MDHSIIPWKSADPSDTFEVSALELIAGNRKSTVQPDPLRIGRALIYGFYYRTGNCNCSRLFLLQPGKNSALLIGLGKNAVPFFAGGRIILVQQAPVPQQLAGRIVGAVLQNR